MGPLVLILMFGALLSGCCGVAVARRARPLGRSLLHLALLLFALSYVFGALLRIWLAGASVLDSNSLLHAFGPGEMPDEFLSFAQVCLVPAAAIAVPVFFFAWKRQKGDFRGGKA
ncbi:hypothetical protein D1822_14515 [Phaeobacter inhibens]|uniref:hypothetical protein n=1 Tax=Phaeobacter inhibens TaxID=221822 RepID=UPI0001632CE7|nr:hypothetical protein [Phaeobacter inhibens]AFO92612.1 hypothetical protein PGA1_c29560 [Phaeobacter inhibens DSM 17395]AUQ47316.1 hypothetical protein PhaeoP10_03004 [Phaeobacter inhibens]AXT23930.1 hypothetical protein D1822_14515 [Phaeobacter inhibens]